jgi:hypothetical protein
MTDQERIERLEKVVSMLLTYLLGKNVVREQEANYMLSELKHRQENGK